MEKISEPVSFEACVEARSRLCFLEAYIPTAVGSVNG